jgi:hypothetical protein
MPNRAKASRVSGTSLIDGVNLSSIDGSRVRRRGVAWRASAR